MKISVEEVIEHIRADRIEFPDGSRIFTPVYGERQQSIEVVIRVVNPQEDIDAWRESVGRTLTVIPWEQEAPSG